MILKIIINILLCITLFLEMVTKDSSLNILKGSILMCLICISISLYILSDLKFTKNRRENLLLVNSIYLLLSSFIFKPLIVLISPVICDYIVSKKYSDYYICSYILVSIFLQVRLELNYSIICLGIVVTMFVYESVKNTNRKYELEQINYGLREKIHIVEEKRTLENKLNLRNIESIKIKERNLISQKIHDNIGHTLAGSIMQLEAVKIIVKNDTDKGIYMIDSIANNLRDGMDDVRNTLRSIKPEQSEIGINHLKLILDEFTKEYGKECNLKLEGDINDINVLYWRAIIQSVKETLTNTIKHSNGDSLNVDIRVLNKIIRLFIRDNGIYSGNIDKGMGLVGIEERIMNLGGDVIFSNEDGFSTLIILKR